MSDTSHDLSNIIASRWAELLGHDTVSADDNFFLGGGNSLLAMRLTASVRNEIGIQVAVRWIFDNPTFAGYVKKIEAELRDDDKNERKGL